MIIVCLTCNITLPRRRGSRPDGARYMHCNHILYISSLQNLNHLNNHSDCYGYILANAVTTLY